MLKNAVAVLCLALLCFAGCQSAPKGSATLEEAPQSLARIKKAVASSLPGGVRGQSSNGREFYSHYYSRYDATDFDPARAKERAYVHVVILGDRRPYDVQVTVIIEKRTRQGYQQAGIDKAGAKRYVEAIKAKLGEGQDDRNVIDDFRVF